MGLPFELIICGLGELERGAAPEITHACSILDPELEPPQALAHVSASDRLDLRFYDVVDGELSRPGPHAGHVERFLEFGRRVLAYEGRPRVLVHCQLGLSRSTAVAILLVAQVLPQLDASKVVNMVVTAREEAWPNLALVGLGDAALRRNGTLVGAVQALLRSQAFHRPYLAAFMERDGLGRHVMPDGTVLRLALPRA